MVSGLRKQGDGGDATKNLARLNIHARGNSALGGGSAGGSKQVAGVARATASKTAKKSGKTALPAGLRQGREAASSLKRSDDQELVETAEQDAKAALEKGTSTLIGGAARTTTAAGKSAGKTAGKAALGGAKAGGRAALGTSRAGGKLVKGGLVAAQRRMAAAKAAKAAKATAKTGGTAIKGGVTAARAVRAAAVGLKAIASAIGAALSSTPILVAIAAIVGVLIMILSIIAFLPGIGEAQHESEGTGSNANYPIEDDYPFKGTGYTSPNPKSGYYYGNCTDFAWWRVNRDAGVSADDVTAGNAKFKWAQLTPNGGNGGQWGNPGNMPGWTDTRDPVPGDIISIHHGGTLGASASDPGHVAYIAAVDGSGAVTIENYGRAKYFITKTTVNEIDSFIDNGWVVVKHNPAGRIGGLPDGDANGDAKAYAREALNDDTQYQCLVNLWNGESGWNPAAENPSSGAYGIPQALPANKMASAGDDWKTNPITQVKWGLTYIRGRPDYGTPCAAWEKWQSRSPHWY